VLAGKPQRDCTIVHSMVTTQEPAREDEVRRFKEQSFAAFSENYYDPADAQEAEWPLPDMESRDEPHYPLVMSWDSRVMGYKSLTPPIVDFLTEGEFRAAAEAILAKVGRVLE